MFFSGGGGVSFFIFCLFVLFSFACLFGGRLLFNFCCCFSSPFACLLLLFRFGFIIHLLSVFGFFSSSSVTFCLFGEVFLSFNLFGFGEGLF